MHIIKSVRLTYVLYIFTNERNSCIYLKWIRFYLLSNKWQLKFLVYWCWPPRKLIVQSLMCLYVFAEIPVSLGQCLFNLTHHMIAHFHIHIHIYWNWNWNWSLQQEEEQIYKMHLHWLATRQCEPRYICLLN